jgi:adenine-specific DNA-methyltransferase
MTPQEVELLLGDCFAVFSGLSQYRGLVDCILIDPPYNSGNRRLPYRDCRTAGEWSDFIHSRIAAAYPFLSRRGCIAVHINDNQLGSLLRIMEDIFGKSNQLHITPWQAGKSGTGAGRAEFVVIFARDKASWKLQAVPRPTLSNNFSNPDNDPRGPWRKKNAASGLNQRHRYPIQNYLTGDYVSPPGNCSWRREPEAMVKRLARIQLCYRYDAALHRLEYIGPPCRASLASGVLPDYFFDREDGRLYRKEFRSVRDARPTAFPSIIQSYNGNFPPREGIEAKTGKAELRQLTGKSFDTVKPVAVEKLLLEYLCPVDGLVLDFFAGTGTTGHAVLSLNRERGHSRRCLLIEEQPDIFAIAEKRLAAVEATLPSASA